MPRLTPDQIRATIAAMRVLSPQNKRSHDALERAALDGDGPTLVVLRVKARQFGTLDVVASAVTS